MVVEFRVENFRSIRDELVLSFEAETEEKFTDRLISHPERKGLSLLPSILAYGGNASGKSNICRAFLELWKISRDSATSRNRGDHFEQIIPFRLSAETASQPTTFGIQFLIGSDLWDYSVRIDSGRVYYEALKKKPNTQKPRWSVVFERKSESRADWVGNAPRLNSSFFDSVRDNVTILSKAASENIEAVLPVYDAILSVTIRNMADRPRDVVEQAAEACMSDQTLSHWLAKLISCADVPVDEILIDDRQLEFENLPREIQAAFRAMNPDAPVPSNFEVSELKFLVQRDDGHPVVFDIDAISNGTVRFLAVLLNIWSALKEGSLLILDEFDASLHPLLAMAVRDLVNDKDINPLGAQFLLVTHNDSLLDSGRLRRDQILFVGRGESKGTEIYAMSDLDRKPKPDESFQKRYLFGGYGGVPRIGDLRSAFLEELAARNGA